MRMKEGFTTINCIQLRIKAAVGFRTCIPGFSFCVIMNWKHLSQGLFILLCCGYFCIVIEAAVVSTHVGFPSIENSETNDITEGLQADSPMKPHGAQPPIQQPGSPDHGDITVGKPLMAAAAGRQSYHVAAPAPVAVSRPTYQVAAPAPVAVSRPTYQVAAPAPVAVSRPTYQVAAPAPVAVSRPTYQVAAPAPVAVSRPTYQVAAPAPVAVSR
ncbi:hypothetical protein GJAV_G00152740, partial [Gymnothorax javanicus]